jgi:hypothetical protein
MVMQSTEWLCEQVAIDLLTGRPSLEDIQTIHSRDFVVSAEAKCIALTAKTEEVLVPSDDISKRVVRVSLAVDLLTVIPEESEEEVDRIWREVDQALLNPNPAKFFLSHEFSHFTVSGLSASDSATDEDRIIHNRTYTFIVARS